MASSGSNQEQVTKPSGSGKKRAANNPVLFPLAELPGSNDGVDVNSWGAEPWRVTHLGILCRGPQCTEKTEFIRGIRYKCSRCPNVDFDDVCMRDPANNHSRDHAFWPCSGPSIFEDWVNMSPDEIEEVREIAGDVPGEYLIVPEQGEKGASSVPRRSNTLDLAELAARLFGINNQISDDQLLAHWKNGKPAARLIDLLPGNLEDPIECLFTSTRLDDQREQYDALCCAWTTGETTNEPTAADGAPDTVYIGEECRGVTRSTAEALKALRSPSEIKKLWVEELCDCIPVEKEHASFQAFQQRSTSLIYNRAQRTIIWVGPDNEHTEAAVIMLEMLSHHCNKEKDDLPSPSDLADNPDLEELGLLPVGSEKWESLSSFFPPHLFTQGWLLHDVAFATEKVVKIGDYEIEWDKVDRVRNMLSQPSWMHLTWRQQRHDDSGFFESDLGL